MSNRYEQPCWFCGGEVVERRVEVTRSRNGKLVVIENVPAGVCLDCGERVFRREEVLRMDHILKGDQKPDLYKQVPVHRVT